MVAHTTSAIAATLLLASGCVSSPSDLSDARTSRGSGPASQSISNAATGRASIQGLVCDQNGRPVSHALVRILTATGSRTVTSGVDGRFEARELSAGEALAMAASPGLVTRYYGQGIWLHSPPRSFTLTDNATTNLEPITLIRGATIVGRLTDHAGKGVSGAVVTAMPASLPPNWGRDALAAQGIAAQGRVHQNQRSTTDADGMFRIDSVPSGAYVMVAAAMQAAGEQSHAVPWYFPGSKNPDDAAIVHVVAGTSHTLSMQMNASTYQTLSGTIAAEGRPWDGTGGAVVAQRRTTDVAPVRDFSASAQVMAGGRFELGLPPGDYDILAMLGRPWSGPGIQDDVYAVRALVSIGARGSGGLRLNAHRGQVVSGLLADDDGLPSDAVRGARVSAVPRYGPSIVNSAIVEADGKFVLRNVFPGDLLRAWARGGQPLTVTSRRSRWRASQASASGARSSEASAVDLRPHHRVLRGVVKKDRKSVV